MDIPPQFLEQLWSDLLSREPGLIQAAFDSLDPPSQKTVFAHLQRMAHDPGWQPEQRDSALSALKSLENRFTQD